MKYSNLLYSQDKGIGIVTINRPESLNTLNRKVYTELYQLFQVIEDDQDVRVVILTGNGEKAFIAGSDVAEMQPQNSVEISGYVDIARKASDQIYSLSKPVIAAVNGFALGGGCELAMCCDIRIASENAKFGQPEINLGIIPGAGGTQRLSRLVGITRAKELILTGAIIDANTALMIGLVNKVVPLNELMTEAIELAKKLGSKSRIAMSLAKKAANFSADTNLSSGFDLETQYFVSCFDTEDQKEGMAAFLEKRKPQFKDR